MFENAESYEHFMGRWSRLVASSFVDFTGISDLQRVLDVGSGTGCLSISIAEKIARSNVVGIDPSEEYVKYASRENPFPQRVSYQVGDARKLNFPDATFQASLSLLALNFIPNPKKALTELQRVTESGGLVSAAVWDYGSGMQMLRVFWDAAVGTDSAAEKYDEKHMPLCRRGELASLWEQTGLLNVHEQPLYISMRFDSFEDFWNPFLLGQGPSGAYVAGLDQAHLAILQNEVKRRLPFTQEQDDAHFELSARVWAVRGRIP
jgi:SAM-dependent methyltransferase